jgi:hypothetical protein
MSLNPFFPKDKKIIEQQPPEGAENTTLLLKEILADELNFICFDCRMELDLNITLNYSINNGIILCSKCAEIHKSTLSAFSEIKTCNPEELEEEEILLLYYGGNRKLTEFIEFEFPQLINYDNQTMYKTVALEYYRQNLRCLAFAEPKPLKPTKEEGYQIMHENLYGIEKKNYIKLEGK